MLNYFNLELEKRSLKVIAYEVNRTNKELLSYLVDETLRNAIQDDGLVNSFYKIDANYNSEAFIAWSRSSLQRESLNSNITILDRNFNELGKFTVGFDEPIDFKSLFEKNGNSEKFVGEIESSTEAEVKFAGIIPVKRDSIITGYITVAVIFNIENLGAEEFPDFLVSNKAALGSVVDLNLVKIFEISEGKIERVRGDIFPSKEHKEQILNANLSLDNDSWLNLSFNKEDYITYILVTNRNGIPNITAVAIKDKEITWSLYNFFKIFIIHSVYILALILLLLIFHILKLKYSFRTKLLGAFLLISIIPIIALAVYNREVVRERTGNAVFDVLSKRSEYLENHIKVQMLNYPERNIYTAFENAGRELNISFTIYEIADEIFSSRNEYYENGLLPSKLKSDAHFNLNYLSYREYLTTEQIGNYTYDAYYKKINIEDKTYILCVNDAFNKIRLYYSPVDADVFLFGVYSFAVIIITLLSTIFANQISSPIQKLTRATNAVARGDLNIKLQNKEKGELKELFDGFNSMTNELQKNQQEISELERENAWKEMAKQVAHEIKNPLTPMKLSIQQLIASFNDKKVDFEETFKKLSQAVLNQIENLNLIASEFSSFAKMPSLKVEPFDLIPEINDTLNLFADDEIEIRFNSSEKIVMIDSDKSQIKRMIINLIRNSIQAQANLAIINLNVVDNSAEIEISDNGKGIGPENQRKIFDSNFTTKEKGLGLGLKLVKRFLENTNSEIKLISSSAEGTSFKINIPVKKNN
jgi:signal transduction histidine kinase